MTCHFLAFFESDIRNGYSPGSFNSSPLNIYHPKRKGSSSNFQPSFFRGKLAVKLQGVKPSIFYLPKKHLRMPQEFKTPMKPVGLYIKPQWISMVTSIFDTPMIDLMVYQWLISPLNTPWDSRWLSQVALLSGRQLQARRAAQWLGRDMVAG